MRKSSIEKREVRKYCHTHWHTYSHSTAFIMCGYMNWSRFILCGWGGRRERHHTQVHTKAKSKESCCHKGHAHLAKPRHLCTKQVLCAGATQSPGAGQETRRSTNCVSHCRCGHPKSHRRISDSMRHSQCTLLPSTRPGTRMGGLGTWDFFPLLWDSNRCPLGCKPKTYTHTHTLY